MMKRILAFSLGSWVVSSLGLSAQTPATCSPAAAIESRLALQYVRRLVAVPKRDEIRGGMGLARMDSNQVVLVQNEEVCTKALNLIAASLRPSSPVPTKIVLVEVGSKYFARTPGLRVGGSDRQFILNHPLDQVLRDY